MKIDLEDIQFLRERKDLKFYKVLAIVGTLALVALGGYFIYKFFTSDYLDDLEDDFEDDFEYDFEYEDEE